MTDINKVAVTMSGGVPVAYECEYHVQTGAISNKTAQEVPSYYDLIYPCDSSINTAISIVASKLLQEIATTFKILPDGTACSIPDTSLPVWLLGLSSEPADSLYSGLSCQKLKPDAASGQCCSVVYAPMTFWATGNNVQNHTLMKIVATGMDSGNVTAGTDLEIAYIGSVMAANGGAGAGTDQALGNTLTAAPQSNWTSPSLSAAQQQNTTQVKSKNFTVIGGVVLGGLVATFLGMVLVLVRRRRMKQHRDTELAISKSEGNIEDGQGSEGPTLEVDVMSDDMPTHHSQRDYDAQDDYHPSSYTFDLANCMKNDVMGTYGMQYGPTSISVVPPYPMAEETSDSEVDSWAQTDGTVGSLEERLEEITAEI